MEKQTDLAADDTVQGTSLQQLVSTLVNSSLPAAIHNKTIVMNEVGQGVVLGIEKVKVIPILKELLDTVIMNSRHGEIHITAERYHGIVVLQIQERNNYNGYALAFSVSSIEPEAVEIGGHIAIKDPRARVATISFTFPDLAA
jgi:hypothetical protein